MPGKSTSLSAQERVRYARQISLSEIGVPGQARLRASVVRVETLASSKRGKGGNRAASKADSASVAALYLERAGVTVERSSELFGERAADAVVPIESSVALLARAGDERLLHAAAWLNGSFAAVETLKAFVGAGRSAHLPSSLVLSRTELLRAPQEQKP